MPHFISEQLKSLIIDIDKIRLNPANTRSHNERNIQAIAYSLKTYGQRKPLVVNGATGVIEAGNGMWTAAKKVLGWDKIAAVFVDEDEQMAKGYEISDNRTGDLSGFDMPALKDALEFLDTGEFDLEKMVGFSENEIEDLMTQFYQGDKQEGFEDDDESPGPAIIKEADFESLKPTNEEHEILKDKKFLVEFSGGKDSSLATLWIRNFYPKNEIELMFVDGGVDFIGFETHLHIFANYLGMNLIYLRAKENIIDAFLKRGKWPNPFVPYCQNEIIFKSIDEYIINYNKNDIIIIGGSNLKQKPSIKKNANQNRMIKSKKKTTKGYIYFQPIMFLENNLVMPMLENIGCPLWEGYSYGLQRTACRICPGQKPIAYAAIK